MKCQVDDTILKLSFDGKPELFRQLDHIAVLRHGDGGQQEEPRDFV